MTYYPSELDALNRVANGNISNKFREAFEAYAPGDKWAQELASGDIVQVDGNAFGSSYLVVSKDPLSANGATSIESVARFEMPVDVAIGLHLSQRTLGQEFGVEFVSDEVPLASQPDVTIASISQSTTTLSVTTATAHGLFPGMRIGIRDCTDSRLNYSALVVATTPTPTTFTATAGPGGTIPSVTAGPFTNGSVYQRTAMSRAQNGASIVFENATATNASAYVRSASGDMLPSGTAAGNHSLTIGTTASVQVLAAAGAYSFQPTNEFRLSAFVDGLQWSDVPVDSVAASTNRLRRTQVVPDQTKSYLLRFRAANLPGLTRPIAQIVSAAKTGTTTATVVTDVPHGLTTGDQINAYGARDATNFANLTAATSVASIVNATTFTVVWGAAVTSTTFGGYVSRVNGGQVQQGVVTQVLQSISRTANVVTAVGSAAWTGVLIGDYVNLVGVRDTSTGATLGLDGAYRIRDIVTTNLVLEPIGATPTGTDIVSTNCGGGVLRRTDLRVSFVRVLDFDRHRVELMPRPAGDEAASIPVRVNGTPTVALSGTANAVHGNVAEDAAAGTNPVIVGGVARTAAVPATIVAGDAVRDTHAIGGAKIIKPFSIPETVWNTSLSLTTSTAVAIQLAGGAGIKRYLCAMQAVNTGASAVDLIILDGVTERWRMTLQPNVPYNCEFPVEIVPTANTALNANLSAAGTVRANFQGYTAA